MMKLNRITNLGSFESPSFFESGGYTVIRIPGIVSLVNGDMLVYYECRRGGDSYTHNGTYGYQGSYCYSGPYCHTCSRTYSNQGDRAHGN